MAGMTSEEVAASIEELRKDREEACVLATWANSRPDHLNYARGQIESSLLSCNGDMVFLARVARLGCRMVEREIQTMKDKA